MKKAKKAMKTQETQYAPDIFKDHFSGGTYLGNLFGNCNSPFRELATCKRKNDKRGIAYWTARIELLVNMKRIAYEMFYEAEHQIKSKDDFNRFFLYPFKDRIVEQYGGNKKTYNQLIIGDHEHLIKRLKP